jgi:hypothetical protein
LGAGAAYALIMWTSNLVALVFTPGLAAYVLVLIFWRIRDEGRRGHPLHMARYLLAPGIALVLGLGLSAAFFLPAMVEQGYINRTQWFGEYYDPAQHFVYFHQLFDPSWGFGISQPGPDDASQGAMSFQLGAAATLFSLTALAVAARRRSIIRREVWFWGLWALVSIFLTLNVSALAWRVVPIVPLAQFPWRYLMLAILPLSILPGILVAEVRGTERHRRQTAAANMHPLSKPGEARHVVPSAHWPAFVLAAVLLLSSYPYLKVEMREPTKEQGPVSMAALMRFQRSSDEMTGVTAWVDPERRPRWSDMAELWARGQEVTTRVDYSQVPQNETLAVNSNEVGSAHEEVYFYAAGTGRTITFNRFWYPGWQAYLLDGRAGRPVRTLTVEREAGPLARVVVPVPAGEGYILLRFEDTPLRITAKWLTLGSIAGILGAILLRLLLRHRAAHG